MKAYVTVMMKTTVLDPQGKTIHGALKKMGFKGVSEVRQGKVFELALDAGLSQEAARAEGIQLSAGSVSCSWPAGIFGGFQGV